MHAVAEAVPAMQNSAQEAGPTERVGYASATSFQMVWQQLTKERFAL